MISSHEAAKALLAMEPFMLAKIPTPPKKPVAANLDAAPATPDAKRCPTKPFSKRIADLFRRRHTTPWSDKEIAAYRALPKYDTDEAMAAEMDMLDAYYKAERAKGENGRHRRDLSTFLNNFCGELDRARAHHEASQRRIQRSDPKPVVVPFVQPEEDAALRERAVEEMRKARAAL